MNRKVWTAFVAPCIGILAALILVGCAAKTEKVTIGWIGPLSGQYASYGKMVKAGTDIAVEDVNKSGGVKGRKLVVVYEDDQLDPKRGVAALNKLISRDKVPLVIQAAGSNVMLAEAPIAERRKVILISPTCTNPQISDAGDYIFRIAPSDVYQGKVIAELACEKLRAKSAAVLFINNDYGVGLKDVFQSRFKQLGGTLVASEGFNPNATDFRAILRKVQTTKPDVVFLSSLYQEAALILKQAQELGLKVQFIGGDGCFAPELIKRAGGAAEGMLVVNMHWDPKSKDPLVSGFVTRFKKRTSKDPEVYAALGYDCLRIVAEAVRQGGPDSDAMRRALYQIKGFPGVTGPTAFDSRGDAAKQYDTFVVRKGAFARM